MSQMVTHATEGGICVITVDNPPVNALSTALRRGIRDAVRAAQQDASEAILLRCAGRTFIAGADITEFGKPLEEPWLPELCNEIEASAKLVVAALHGTTLGGGFEVALSCHYRIALTSARIGFPEVSLGLIPGAGGTQRTPRLAGPRAALELIAAGKPIPAAEAAALGLVDRVVAGGLDAAALAYTRELIDARAAIRRAGDLDAAAVDPDVYTAFRAELGKRARGQTAPQRIVTAVEAATLPFAEGLARERELFEDSLQDPQSAALRHLFFAERKAAKISGLPPQTASRDVTCIGVVGAGTMGGGIAMSFANAGYPVTVVEVDDAALQRGLAVVDRNYAGSVARGKLDESGAAECRARIAGTTDYAGLADADLVVEAVFEDPAIKCDVFARLDAVCKPGAILATNTSYQDVDRIAAATSRPGDVLGLHFFSPAHIMKLLEVVRAAQTADDVLATCMALAKRIGKVPVMAGNAYGFIGNRMLRGYLREAQLCLLEGGTPEAIDAALTEFGFAMGPFAVADLAGIDVAWRARQALPESARGDPRAFRVADALVAMGRLGQKSGAGFYSYHTESRVGRADPAVLELAERTARELGIERQPLPTDEIVDRLVLALVNEGLSIVGDGIAQRPGDVDVVYVHGYGFPAWRGGPLHFGDSHGLQRVLARIRTFRDRFGAANWTPAPLLERLVAEGKTIELGAERMD
jgi:3-hydroxyacyl-CoA dehydrogenase